MSLRKEQCNKVCRILDNVLANRPTERDSLIVAVRKAFEALNRLSPAEPKKGRWMLNNVVNAVCPWCCSECNSNQTNRTPYCQMCGAKMED